MSEDRRREPTLGLHRHPSTKHPHVLVHLPKTLMGSARCQRVGDDLDQTQVAVALHAAEHVVRLIEFPILGRRKRQRTNQVLRVGNRRGEADGERRRQKPAENACRRTHEIRSVYSLGSRERSSLKLSQTDRCRNGRQ